MTDPGRPLGGAAALLADALARAGVRLGPEAGLLVLDAELESEEEIRRAVDFVLRGGLLLLLGGPGPLAAALHVLPEETVATGALEPCQPGLPALEVEEARPATGVGYALYRLGGTCAVVAGPRGEGWVLYLPAPLPALAKACVGWIFRQSGSARRSREWESMSA